MVLEAATDRDGLIEILCSNQSLQNLICCLHRHAAEIWNKMSAVGVGSEATFYARLVYFNGVVKHWMLHTITTLRVLSPKGKQIATVATPVCRDVGESFETMGNAMVDFLLVRVGFVICLTDTLGDNLRVAFFVASVLAIRALHTRSIFKEFSTQRTAHDVVELLCDELVALLLVNIVFLLTHGTLTV